VQGAGLKLHQGRNEHEATLKVPKTETKNGRFNSPLTAEKKKSGEKGKKPGWKRSHGKKKSYKIGGFRGEKGTRSGPIREKGKCSCVGSLETHGG